MPFTNITWTISADFGSGFTSINSYVSTQDFSLSVSRASPFDGSIQASELSMVLRNVGDAWSPRNSSSALYGKILSRIPIKIEALFNSTTYSLWAGYIIDYAFNYLPGSNTGTVKITARDYLGLLSNTNVTIPNYTNITADDAVTELFAVVDSSAPVTTSGTNFTTFANFFAQDKSALAILKEIAMSDLNAWVYTNKGGSLVYASRTTRLWGTVDQTWGDGTNIKPFSIQENFDNKVYNRAETSTLKIEVSQELVVVFKALIGEDAWDKKNKVIGRGKEWKFSIVPNQYGILSWDETTLTCERNTDYTCAASLLGSADSIETTRVTVTFPGDGTCVVTNVSDADVWLRKLQIRAVAVGDVTVQAATQKFPSAVTTSGAVGTVDWTNAANATTNNSSPATVALNNSTSYLLVTTDYDFQLPANSQISYVNAMVRVSASAASGTAQLAVTQVIGGVVQALTTDNSGNYYNSVYFNTTGSYDLKPPPTTYTDYRLGAQILSGWKAVNAATINASNYGMAVVIQGSASLTWSVDSVSIIVYHTAIQGAKYDTETLKGSITSVRTLPLIGSTKGGGVLKADLPFNGNLFEAGDYAMEKLRIYRYPFSRLKLLFRWQHDDIITNMLNLELGMLIKYKDTLNSTSESSYSDDWYRVEEIKHTVGIGTHPITQVTLIPSYQYRDTKNIAWDDFNRPDTPSGGLGLSSSGDTWTGVGTAFKIASNQGELVTKNGNRIVGYLPITGPAVVSEGRIYLSVSSGTPYAHGELNIRQLTGGQFYFIYVAKQSGVNGYLPFIRWGEGDSNSFYDTRGLVNLTAEIPSTGIELRIMRYGDRISAWYDGILLEQWTDSTVVVDNISIVGWAGNSNVTVKFDDYYVQGL